MNAVQIYQINSFRARRTVLSDQTATGQRLAFTPALAALDKQLAEIDGLTLTQSQPLPATFAGRAAALTAMKEAALTLAGAAANYADDRGLPALALKVRLKPSDFDRVRLERRAPVARHLHETLEPIVAELADYGITPAELDDFQTKIVAAEAMLFAPRATTVDKRAATMRLPVAVRNATAIFRNRIDPLVRSVRETHPDFHARYQAARKIGSRPGSRAANPSAETPVASPAAPQPAAPPA